MTEQRGPTNAPGDAWQEYLAAAQEMDAVRRVAAAEAARQHENLMAAREELVAVRRRLTVQQARFVEATGRHGVRLPTLVPSGAEVNAALAPDAGPAGALAALRQAETMMREADGELAALDGAKSRARHRASFLRTPKRYLWLALVILALSVAGAGLAGLVLLP